MKQLLYLSITMVVICLFSSCMGILPGAETPGVKKANQINLIKGNPEIQGIWNSDDLSLVYNYHLTEKALRINGTITLASKITHFSVMDKLSIDLSFVDSEGRVIGRTRVYTSPYRKWIPMLTLDFSRQLSLPSGTVAMAFTYQGKVSDGVGGREGGSSWDFWNSL